MKNILISGCLLGIPCRYDGKSKTNKDVVNLKDKYNLVPFCPEVYGGLPTPRDPSEIIDGKVISSSGEDFTKEYKKGANEALRLCMTMNIDIAILKSKSPSCSKDLIYDGSHSGKLIPGLGITAKVLIDNNIQVLSEHELDQLL